MLNKTEKDILKLIKRKNRIDYKFEKPKTTCNKKKYRRKKFKFTSED